MTNLEDSFPKKIHTTIKIDPEDLKKLDDLVDKAEAEAEINKQVALNKECIAQLTKAVGRQTELLEKIVAKLTEGG